MNTEMPKCFEGCPAEDSKDLGIYRDPQLDGGVTRAAPRIYAMISHQVLRTNRTGHDTLRITKDSSSSSL